MPTEPITKIRGLNYDLLIFDNDLGSEPIEDYNVDVQVNFDHGDYYTATFFTLKNIYSLFGKNKLSGECSSGLFFACPDMIIVETLSTDVIQKVVSDLLNSDDLSPAFTLHKSPEPAEGKSK